MHVNYNELYTPQDFDHVGIRNLILIRGTLGVDTEFIYAFDTPTFGLYVHNISASSNFRTTLLGYKDSVIYNSNNINSLEFSDIPIPLVEMYIVVQGNLPVDFVLMAEYYLLSCRSSYKWVPFLNTSHKLLLKVSNTLVSIHNMRLTRLNLLNSNNELRRECRCNVEATKAGGCGTPNN